MRTIFPICIQLALQVRCETEGTRRPPGADCERRKLLQRPKDERKVHRSAKAAERCQFGAVQPELARAGRCRGARATGARWCHRANSQHGNSAASVLQVRFAKARRSLYCNIFGHGRNGGKKMTCARQRTHTNSRTDASIEEPCQCRCDIDRADEARTTWRTLVLCRTRVGFHTGMNLAVRPVSDLFVRR
jgi:hypothetical protein